MNPKVSIITLNWNGWEDTIECLESLYQITYPNYEVIVVDNGSEDESIKKIKEYCEGKIEVESKFFEYDPSNKPIKIIEYTREEAEVGGGKEKEIAEFPSSRKLILIKNEKNYGFAEGNNIGMRYALKVLNPDYVLLLNNDTVVDKGFLGELVKVGYTRLLRTAREINDEMIYYWTEKVILECLRINKPLNKIKICVKGITFRGGVKELYHSRNLALAKLLSEKGLDVYVNDDLYSKEEIEEIGLRFIEPEDADLILDCFDLKIRRSV